MKSKEPVHLPYYFSDSRDKGAEGEERWKDVTVDLCREVFGNSPARILDFGCGRGELLEKLSRAGYEVVGVDPDSECVRLSSRFAPSHVLVDNELTNRFGESSFDAVIALHVLEHVDNPRRCVEELQRLAKRFLIFGVPNLGTMTNIQFFRTRSVNEGHLHGWDYNHFKNFAEFHCGLRHIKWQPDFVVAPKISNFLHRIGMRKLVEDGILPKMFPFQSNSIIGLFEVTKKTGTSG